MTFMTSAMKVPYLSYHAIGLFALFFLSTVPPLKVGDIDVVTGMITASFSFSVSVVVHGQEEYQIHYGTTNGLGQVSAVLVVEIAGAYTIQIDGLHPGTTYYFMLRGENDIGITSTTEELSFTTIEDGRGIYCKGVRTEVIIYPIQRLVDLLRTSC